MRTRAIAVSRPPVSATILLLAMFFLSLLFAASARAQTQQEVLQQMAASMATMAEGMQRLAQTPAPAPAPSTTTAVSSSVVTGDCSGYTDRSDQAICLSNQALSRANAAHGRLDAHDTRIQKVETHIARDIAALKSAPAQPAVARQVRHASTTAATTATRNGGIGANTTAPVIPGDAKPAVERKDHTVSLHFNGTIPNSENVARLLREQKEGYRLERVVLLVPGSDQVAREVTNRSNSDWTYRVKNLNTAMGPGVSLPSAVATDKETADVVVKARSDSSLHGALAYAIMRAN